MEQPNYTITGMAPASGTWSVRITAQGERHDCAIVAWASLSFAVIFPGDRHTEVQPVFVYDGRAMTEAEFRETYSRDAEFKVGPA